VCVCVCEYKCEIMECSLHTVVVISAPHKYCITEKRSESGVCVQQDWEVCLTVCVSPSAAALIKIVKSYTDEGTLE